MNSDMDRKGIITVGEIESSEKVDEMFFRQIQMRGDKVMKKFSSQFYDTRARVFESAEIEYCMKKVSMDSIGEESVTIGGNIVLESRMLASVLAKSEDIVLCVITVHGYDKVESQAKDGFDMLFVDGWGTALAECGYSYLKKKLDEELKNSNMFSTYGWSPGQHNVDISLQKPLFEALNPEQIGVKLSDSFMMYPKKTISGIVGIGSNPEQKGLRACDVCPKRETCPSAYSDNC